MKKVLSMLLTVILCISFMPSFAKSGDIAGKIYSTDIKAYINGIEVPSYNIGGKTVVLVEDIVKYNYYNDDLRTLIIGDLAPYNLIEGKNTQTLPSGSVIGNVYETDIKTYIYNKQLTSYSLNGKMAVAIEELGDDNTFSNIGGKFIWDEKERTISLEFMYSKSINKLMREKGVNMNITDDYEISFESKPIVSGNVSGFKIPESDMPQPLTLDGKVMGYICCPTSSHFYDDGNNISLIAERGAFFFYFFEEKVAEYLKDTKPVSPTQQDWLDYYESQWYTIIDSYETDEYIFLYMSQPNFHGSTQSLRRIAKDGSLIEYDNEFDSVSLHGNKFFDNVIIDKENEKVTFGYDVYYEIDLKTGEITKLES